MLVILGYLLVMASIVGGFMGVGGQPAVLIQPFEVLIICGAAMGAFISGNSFALVKASIVQATGTLKPARHNKAYYLELLLCFYALTNKTRKEGLLSLEDLIENPENSTIFTAAILADHHLMEFIRDNLRLIVTGVENHQLEELMDQELEIHHEEGYGPIKAIQRIGDGMPAFGIVAAVIGVVHTMESINLPPAELGKLIAAALVGTFLGILLAYGFIAPVAALMEERLEAAGNAFKCAQKGLLCCAQGIPPVMTAEYMRSIITSNMRPDFAEMEMQLKANKG
ncbi:proton conductor component of flagella motor [Candidatus Methylobacter favarea]|uniref:Proton conductor component of flagella motor n=1 Tax=Candidatus Methylobacter favarea TaxID=2707345 RepID=A0A8S0Y5T7_9GAMM|nr:flagellar motor stator protein MotA [Candidatus Methylobacter favarea]CAA9889758.1 proton conductor component of flagella motor [Candidatus Methylobacter favarea]